MNKIKRQLFSMEAILDSRIINEQVYYLIKWAGYPIAQSTWEKAEKVPVDSHLLADYQMNVQIAGKTFYFDPLDQAPSIEDFVDVPQPKSELATFNQKLNEFQKQLTYLRDDVRNILQAQQQIIRQLKQQTISLKYYDAPRSPTSQDKPQSNKSDGIQHFQGNSIINLDGSFDLGDHVEKIGRAVQIKKTKIKMYYILWKRRQNGFIPKNSWVESEKLLEYDPIKLCQYLWSKLY